MPIGAPSTAAPTIPLVPTGNTGELRAFTDRPATPHMVRFVLLLSLTAFAACGSRNASETPPAPPAAVVQAEAVPAAPPASNAAPVVDSAGATVPADTLDETEAAFHEILAAARAQNVAARPYGEVVQWVGEQLLGRPYVAGMLDAPEEETLIVDLTAFDCVLYVENVLALARAIVLERETYDDYASGVRDLRYRDGQMDGYCSRLHYFSDWIANNEARGTVRNVTAEIGGVPFDKAVTFMGEHRDAYPKLAPDSTYACILEMERELADVELFYIPQDRIAEAYPLLQPGDIVATATSIGGLDVTHTGFVHKTDTHTGFMHASLASDRVKISDDLQSYVQGIPSQVGVVITRPVDPRERAATDRS